MRRHISLGDLRVDRRAVVTSLGAALAMVAAGSGEAAPADFDTTLKGLLGGAKLEESGVAFEIPAVAPHGLMVAFSVTVASPMTEKDFVEAIHIVSTANKEALIATFRFVPGSGKAAISSRLRLAKTQEVLAIAKLNTGRLLAARKLVEVKVGSCG